MKRLLIDIETRPGRWYSFQQFNTTLSLDFLDEPARTICFAAQWYGEKKMMFHSEYQDGGHEGMVQAAHDLMSEADAIIHFNGNSFDIPHLNWEIAQDGLGVPAPHLNIDLRRTTKSRFRPTSGKLQHIVDQLEIGHKLDHNGQRLWVGWMNGDPKSIKLMEKYCKQDTALLSPLYEELLPWLTDHPNMALFNDEEGDQCKHCASTDLEKRGFTYTQTAKRQRYQCRQCGTWLTSGKSIKRVDIRGTK